MNTITTATGVFDPGCARTVAAEIEQSLARGVNRIPDVVLAEQHVAALEQLAKAGSAVLAAAAGHVARGGDVADVASAPAAMEDLAGKVRTMADFLAANAPGPWTRSIASIEVMAWEVQTLRKMLDVLDDMQMRASGLN